MSSPDRKLKPQDKAKLRKKLRKKFGKRYVKAKYRPQYPLQAVREYTRIVDSYTALLRKRLQPILPEIGRAAKDQLYAVDAITNSLAADLENDCFLFGLRDKIKRISRLANRLTAEEWAKAVKMTLGLDLKEDYYSGYTVEERINRWVDQNVDLISTIPQDTLQDMRGIIKDGYSAGVSTKKVAEKIRHRYGVSQRRARFIAGDQIGKLNSEISQWQQQDAGVEKYEWSTSGDGNRVRESHRKLDGKIFSWDNPPVVDAKRNRRCHPGMDYRCRCVAIPVFDLDTIDLPVAQNGDDRQMQFDAQDINLGVGVVVINSEGEILCGIRTDTEEVCGPGGHMQAGESPTIAAIRETREEFGITPEKLYPIAKLTGMPSQYCDSTVYMTNAYRGELKSSDEMIHNQFLPVETLLEIMKKAPEAVFVPFRLSVMAVLKTLGEKDGKDLNN